MVARWSVCPFELIEKQVPKKGFIVDVGCGCGVLANVLILKSKERKVLGLDLSKRRLKLARKSKMKNVSFQLKDVNDLKLKNCDTIVMSDFLHHIPYKQQEIMIRQAYTKLKKKGTLVILDIDKKPYWKLISAKMMDNIMTGFETTYYRDRANFKKMLIKSGFFVKDIDADKGLLVPDVLFVCTKISK